MLFWPARVHSLMVIPAAAQTADVAGTWTVNAIVDGGPLPPSTLTLNREGTKVVGTLSGQQGDMRVEASQKDKAVTIWFTVPTQNGPTAITMNGTFDGDVIKEIGRSWWRESGDVDGDAQRRRRLAGRGAVRHARRCDRHLDDGGRDRRRDPARRQSC